MGGLFCAFYSCINRGKCGNFMLLSNSSLKTVSKTVPSPLSQKSRIVLSVSLQPTGILFGIWDELQRLFGSSWTIENLLVISQF